MSGDVPVTTENLETEILPFLSPKTRADIKLIAVEYVSGLTSSPSGCQLLCGGELYITALASLTADDNPKVQKLVYDTLINLTAFPEATDKLLSSPDVTPKMLETWVGHLYDKTYLLTDCVCQLLTNITRPLAGAEAVAKALGITGGSVDKLLDILCSVDYNPKADLHYLATVVSNLTQVLDVRKEFTDPAKQTLLKLVVFVGYQESDVRRRGAVGALRNCCLDSSCHEWLLSDAVDVLPRLLLPLAGPEEFDEDDMEKLPEELQYLPPNKEREACADIRQMLVEAIIQLCNTKAGREFVKAKNTYVIMRELYKWETNNECRETIHDLIDILIGDEPAPGHETLKEVEVPPELTKKFTLEDSERKGTVS